MKPKYNIGDTVWRLENGKVREIIVRAIGLYEGDTTCARFLYSAGSSIKTYSVWLGLEEAELFATKQELIESL